MATDARAPLVAVGKQIRKILEDLLLGLAVALSKFRGGKALLAFDGRDRPKMSEILPHPGPSVCRELSPVLIEHACAGLFVCRKLSKEPISLEGQLALLPIHLSEPPQTVLNPLPLSRRQVTETRILAQETAALRRTHAH